MDPRNWRAASAWPGRSCRSRGIRSRSKSSRPGPAVVYVNLGPHPPRLWPEDLDRAHELWLRLSRTNSASRLHHRDVVGVALRRLEKDLGNPDNTDLIEEFEKELEEHTT